MTNEQHMHGIRQAFEQIGESIDGVAKAIRKGTQGDETGMGAVEAIAIALSGDYFANPVGPAITGHAEQVARVADALESIAKAIATRGDMTHGI